MQRSSEVVAGLGAFYDGFNTGDVDRFADGISDTEGVSVQGSAPDEGHDDRAGWIDAYAKEIAAAGLKLEGGPDPTGFAEGGVGFARDEPSFVLPNGARLPTRLTAVLRDDGGTFKVVHLHFSVGVPDEDAVEMPVDG